MNNFIQPKGNRYLRFAAWFLVITAFISAISYIGFNEFARYKMQALNQKIRSSVEFDEYMGKILAKPIYTPESGSKTSPVHFQLDFGAGLSEDNNSLVLISSDAAGYEFIYRGPYQKKFTIQADEKLLSSNYGNGADNFTITIIQKNNRTTGTGVIESIRPWQANKTVHIQLLPFRELNKLGLPETFKVEID